MLHGCPWYQVSTLGMLNKFKYCLSSEKRCSRSAVLWTSNYTLIAILKTFCDADQLALPIEKCAQSAGPILSAELRSADSRL